MGDGIGVEYVGYTVDLFSGEIDPGVAYIRQVYISGMRAAKACF